MSIFKHKENRGSVFPNGNKQSERHPDYSGAINVDGEEYWISLWNGEEGGKVSFSISVTKKTEERLASSPLPKVEEDKSDIPF